MSDDLISRKEIIETVNKHTRDDGTLDNDITIILEEVKTTFNKNKVIEKLENYLFEKYCIKDDVKIAEIIEKSGNIDKGFVVVDMPESCRNCMFSAEHEIPLNGHYFCRILTMGIMPGYKKPDWCPIRPMSEQEVM